MSDTDHQIEPTDAERAALGKAIRRAFEISESHDDRAPIVAAILMDDEVIAWGDNEVHVDDDPSRHAEIVAMANAAADNPEKGLKGASIVTTLQPCEMCVGAIGMAGIERVIFAAGRPAVRDRYFAYHGLSLQDFAAAADAPFGWAGPVMQDDVLRLYADPSDVPDPED
ncbi:tRNA-specific adenosine deaminase [Rhodobacteraceae bacterium THAF1]|uniref:nucleoside deaminase n=1 Tax=Palleronia sp. THAF1 TaxID=2587842 RepID=UPI000F3CE45B|nr:deaminase [Palleronia sp. THAF1]QFU09774.1 tRNA-specific adenosine deaminase [Palleronia sp. THAF1]VDC17323.1 tRNA-specific adenosine deaminase [Rhodobacteraceae bacterium THAF1]